jgi:hypothetical protein
MPLPANQWELFKVFFNRVEADRLAAFLESSGVPAYVDHGALALGIEGENKVFVAKELAHRARWLNSLPEITDEELAFLATGRLPNSDG